MTDWTTVTGPTTETASEELTEFANGDFEDQTDDWPDHWTVLSCGGQMNTAKGYVTLEV